MIRSNRYLYLFLFLALGACKKNPVGRLVDPYPSNAVPQTSGVYFVYDDEVKTGGGAGFIPGGGNQFLTFMDQSSPRSGINQISYLWNGGDVFDPETGLTDHLFAGFSLLVSPDFTTLAVTNAKDLSGPAYTQLKLEVRGSLTNGNVLRIEGPSNDPPTFTPVRTELSPAQLSSGWQTVTLTVPTTHFVSVKVFATFSIQYTEPPRTTVTGQGGHIYLDNIRYEQ